MRLACLIALSVITATPLAAQVRPAESFGTAAAAMSRRATYGAPEYVAAAPLAPGRASGALPIRLLTGAVGTGLGMVAGGVAGYHLLPHGDCGDDPGLCETAIGAAIGAVIGAAAGAAIPTGGSTCAFDRRLGAGLLGAAAGGVVGFLVGRPHGGMVLFTVPLGVTIGGAAGADLC